MKKKIGIFFLVFTIATTFLTLGAFAEGKDNVSSQMPFVDSEQISPEHPDIQTESDLMEEFEEMFGEGGAKIFAVAMVGAVFMALFLPALASVIVFGVLNGKTKKKIKEYERFFGPIPQNISNTYNPNSYNYQSQFVNTTNVPMGTAPAGDYVPQSDVNNQQGGSY